MAELLSIQKFDSPPGHWAKRAQLTVDGKEKKELLWASSPVVNSYDVGLAESMAGVKPSPPKSGFRPKTMPVTLAWRNISLNASGGKFKIPISRFLVVSNSS